MKFPKTIKTSRWRKWDLLSIWYLSESKEWKDGWYWSVVLYWSTYSPTHTSDLIPLEDITPIE